MNATTSGVLVGALAYAGRWAEGKNLDIKIAIGTAGIVIFLSVIAQGNEQLGQQLGLLVLTGAALRYVPPIVKGLGIA